MGTTTTTGPGHGINMCAGLEIENFGEKAMKEKGRIVKGASIIERCAPGGEMGTQSNEILLGNQSRYEISIHWGGMGKSRSFKF